MGKAGLINPAFLLPLFIQLPQRNRLNTVKSMDENHVELRLK